MPSGADGCDALQLLDDIVGQNDLGRRQIFLQMHHRRGAGNEKDIGRATKQPGKRDLHRRSAKTRGDGGQGRRLQRIETAEREERHIGGAVARQIVNQRVVVAVRQVVIILHANDFANLASFRDLRGRDVA